MSLTISFGVVQQPLASSLLWLCLCLSLSSPLAYAQSEVSFFILAGQDNAEILARAYFSPLGKSMHSNLSSGFVAGGGDLASEGWQLSIVGQASWAPEHDHQYELSAIGLGEEVHLQAKLPIYAPTAMGSSKPGKAIYVTDQLPAQEEELPLVSFQTPDGLGIPFFPSAVLQLSYSFPTQTYLSVRAAPPLKLSLKDTQYQGYQWGVALGQELISCLAAAQGPFQLLAQLSYARQQMQGQPKVIGSWSHMNAQLIVRTEAQQAQQIYKGQKLMIRGQAAAFSLLLLKELGRWHTFIGGQYSFGATQIESRGIYPRLDIRAKEEEPYYEYFFHDELNPVALSLPHRQWRLGLGLSVQVGAIGLHTEASLSNYKNLSAGISYQF